MARQVIDVSKVVETQTRRRFLWTVVGLCSLIVLLDGYELTVLAFAAPYIQRALDVPMSDFTSIFSLGPIGNIIGGILFGYLGDRIGRRRSLAIAVVCYSFLSLLMGFATSIPEFLVLRLLTGAAVGGLMPVLWTLVIEYSPSRWRVTMLTIVMCAYVGGHASVGFVSAVLVPIFDWRFLFWFGAVAPMIVLVPQLLFLPESVQYLASRGTEKHRIAKILKRINPDIEIGPETVFIVSDGGESTGLATRGQKFHIRLLFAGKLKWITPLLWISFICTTATVFFFSWAPLLAEAAGISSKATAIGMSAFQIGGIIGSLVLARALDKRGPIAIVILPLLAAPLVVGLGSLGNLTDTAFYVLMFATGCMVLGGHHGLQAIIGLFYPTSYRSTGAGWAYGVGRIGSVVGPLVAGILLARGWSVTHVFPIVAMPLLIFAAAIFLVSAIQKRADPRTPWAGDGDRAQA